MKTSKIIAFTACGVALVSLVSVGFATWFVGVQQKNQDVTMNLTVGQTMSTIEGIQLMKDQYDLMKDVSNAQSEMFKVGTCFGVRT